VFGLCLSVASTVVLLRALEDRGVLESVNGNIAVGWLVVEDLVMVLVLVLLPPLATSLAGNGPADGSEDRELLTTLALTLGRVSVFIALMLIVGRRLFPWLLWQIAGTGSRELFTLCVVAAAVGIAYGSAELFGVSFALGAFFAGMVMRESPLSYRAAEESLPLRDAFSVLFFVSVGMLFDPKVLIAQPLRVLVVVAIIVFGKSLAAFFLVLLFRYPLNTALTVSASLAQIGEFSFILGRSGLEVGLITPGQWQILLASSIATMLFTPTLLGVAPRAGSWMAKRMRPSESREEDEQPGDLSDHVVILGFGMGGQLLGRALRQLAAPYVILDLNGATVREARKQGEAIFFGDATNEDALRGAGVDRARAVVAVLSDPYASARALSAIRAINPDVPVIVRTRYHSEAETAMRQGASVAVAEEMEASLEVLAQTFARLDVPGNVIDVLLDSYRRESVGIRPVRAQGQPLESLPSEISKAPIATHALGDGDWAASRTLADVNLRAETGALVIAVKQADRYVTSPPADLRLSPGDVLYLLGDDSDIMLARRRLSGQSS
jgi:CPA2 family monovalent cation:H+ antiporter-2